MRRIFTLLLFSVGLLLASCGTYGPGPQDPGYGAAVKEFPAGQDAVYTNNCAWHPDTFLGTVASFQTSFHECRIFVTPDRLVIALFDDNNKNFVSGVDAPYAKIEWFRPSNYGLSKFFNFKIDGKIHGVRFGDLIDRSGNEVSADVVERYVLDRLRK